MAVYWDLFERCHYCQASIEVVKVENGLVPLDEFGEPYCNLECLAAQGEKANEAAHERFIEAYYGGEVRTMAQEYQEAAEQKRRLC